MILNRPDIHVLSSVRRFAEGRKPMLIDGEWVDAIAGGTFPTVDPATGEKIAEVAEATEEDIDAAVRAARRALEGPWCQMSPSGRGRLLGRLADLVADSADELAQLESLDNGKPVTVARAADMPLVVDHFRYFAGWPTKIEGRTIPTGVPDMLVYTRMEPVGVVGAIIAWNFPLLLCAWKLAPALAAGCTVVLKPAEETPLTALRLGELVMEAGFPPGVVNVCPGFGETAGAALVRHPGVDKIAFTGSVATGREVARAAADTLKEVSLELGGKNPNIILADADLETATAAATQAIFFNSGQVCSAGSRLMVHRDAYDEVVAGVVENARRLRLGAGLVTETTQGPLVSSQQLGRVTGYIEAGVRGGASLALGGRRPGGELSRGYFVEPTVLTDVPDHLTVCTEEIFGPVLVAQPFDSLEEVAARANATEFGLAAGVWTRDIASAHRLAAMLQTGTVWLNCFHAYDAAVPFGGYKHSGYGRDNGREALDKFLQSKSVWTNLA